MREGLAGGNPWGPSAPSGFTGGSLKSDCVLDSSVPETGAGKEEWEARGRRGYRTGKSAFSLPLTQDVVPRAPKSQVHIRSTLVPLQPCLLPWEVRPPPSPLYLTL